MKFTPEELQKLIAGDYSDVFKKDIEKRERPAPAAVEEKKDPKVKVQSRPAVVFSAESDKVKDGKNHFPINTAAQARNALSRVSQYKKVPKWYDGSLSSLVKEVQSKVKSKYPSIKTTKKSAKPGKN